MKLVPIERGGTVGSESGVLPSIATEVLQATEALYSLVGFEPPWICYFATQDGNAVGTCGFKSPPNEGRVEIAYFTFPAFEGRGVATEMVAALMALAKTADRNVVLAAQTLPARNASHRILEKHGFVCVGTVEHPEDGRVLEWREPASRAV